MVFIVVQNLVGIDQFDNMKVLLFCAFGLKTPIYAPKWEFWGYDPQIAALSTTHPKGISFRGNTSYDAEVGPPVLHSSPFFQPCPQILCFTMLFNRPDTPKLLLLCGDLQPRLIAGCMLLLTNPTQPPKRHRDRFNRFCVSVSE